MRSETHKQSVVESISSDVIVSKDCYDITPSMVAAAIDELKPGKYCSNDFLAAEHFKYSDSRINVLLSLFYSSCIIHGYLSNDFMKTVIGPLVKNKTGDTSDVNNCRPIALVTIASKIFENIMLEILQPYLYTCDNQFGLKKGHSTDHCIFIAKNVIDYYRSNNSPVYSCFLDASKCFDKINHWSLFRKLILRGIPVLLVRILVFWYRNQSFCVKWGNITYRPYFHSPPRRPPEDVPRCGQLPNCPCLRHDSPTHGICPQYSG